MDLRNDMKQLLSAVPIAAAALVLAACGGASDSSGSAAAASGGSTKLALVGYSTPQPVYDALIPAFRATAAGKDVGFTESFGPSGDQSRAVDQGLAADV